MGFLPMTRNALKDSKVRWELGKGGAPEEGGARLQLLLESYIEGGKRLSASGFNGEVLDLRPATAVDIVLP